MTPTRTTWWERLLTLEPALVRGFVVSILGLVGLLFKVTLLTGLADLIVSVILSLLGLLAAIIIRPAVTANAKVIAYDDTPLEDSSTILPGEATVPPEKDYEVEKASKTRPNSRNK